MVCWLVCRREEEERKGDKLVNGDILAYSAEFALEANAGWVVGARVDGVEGGTALRVRVVMIILVPFVSSV